MSARQDLRQLVTRENIRAVTALRYAQTITALRNIRIIIARELYSYFCSPIAYIFLIIFLGMMGLFTFGDNLGNFYARGVADLELPFFTWHPWLFMVLVPAIGMRLWSEERNQGTLELLCTMPITLWQAVLAKYLAGITFLGIALLLTFPVVISVNYLGDPDNGKIFCGYLGSFLMAGAFLAISSFTSSLSRNQIISFVLTMVICLLLILCGFPPIINMLLQWTPGWLVDIVRGMSVFTHYSSLQRGVIDSRDIIYFLSLTGFGLGSTLVVLKNR